MVFCFGLVFLHSDLALFPVCLHEIDISDEKRFQVLMIELLI